jgi:hypothetical protein
MKPSPSLERRQLAMAAAPALATTGMAGVVYWISPHLFQRFIGGINPLVAFLVVNALGVALLAFLLAPGWFSIYRKGELLGRLGAAGVAALLASITVLLDLKIVFPRDLNVAFPLSLLFYPAIGFLVEVVFHLLPLAVLLAVLTSRAVALRSDRAVWAAMVIVSLLEPAFQVAPMVAPPHYPIWATVFLAGHLLLFNLLQLFVFRRYDFLTMYTMRLAYYGVWHVAWGHVRLRVLF